MLNQWPKESLLKLKEIIRDQQAKQNTRNMGDREREKSTGCRKAIMQTLKLDNWEDLDAIHRKVCPQVLGRDINCINGCVLSCMSEDMNKLAQVLRTLGGTL